MRLQVVMLRIDEVIAGDVLLCRSDYSGGDITEVTGSKYTHAAICTRPHYAAEASGHRVKEVEIKGLLETYDHIAVLRQPGWWSQDRVKKLQDFIRAAIDRKAKFNCDGIRNFEENRKLHEENLTGKLQDFFKDESLAPEAGRDSYFCSELVAAAHVAVGIVSPSVAVIYDPSIIAPANIGEDFTFGIFCGYLVPYPGYVIPSDDEFLTAPRINEIWDNT